MITIEGSFSAKEGPRKKDFRMSEIMISGKDWIEGGSLSRRPSTFWRVINGVSPSFHPMCPMFQYESEPQYSEALLSWLYWNKGSEEYRAAESLLNSLGEPLKSLKQARRVIASLGLGLTNNDWGSIGSSVSPKRVISYSLVPMNLFGIFWNDGDFGKSGSCFWGSFKGSVPTIERDNNMYALLSYDTESGEDDGRVWVSIHPSGKALRLFNFYGSLGSPELCEGLIKSHMGFGSNWKRSAYDIYNSLGELPYINGGGLCLFDSDTLADTSDLGDVMLKQYLRHCDLCDDAMTSDQSYTIADGRCICEDCFTYACFYCEYCSEYHISDEVECDKVLVPSFNGRLREAFWCETCIEYNAIFCQECGLWYARESDALACCEPKE